MAPRLGGIVSVVVFVCSTGGLLLSVVVVGCTDSEGTTTLAILDLEEGGCCDDDDKGVDLEAMAYGPGAVRGLDGRE